MTTKDISFRPVGRADPDRDQVMRSCRQFFGHPPRPVRARLAEIAEAADDAEYPDVYGDGALLASFESEIAQLLGKEAAVFMPSGTMAQQIALRIHSDRRNCRNVALHPNMMHLYVRGNVEQLQSAALSVSQQSGVWMPARWNSTEIPGWAMCELSCAEGSLKISDDQVRELFGRVLAI